MRFNIATLLSCIALCCSACGGDVLKVQYNGAKVTVSDVKPSDSINVKTDGAVVLVEDLATSRKLKVLLSGKSDNGQFVLKSKTKAQIQLDNLKLQSNDGAPITLKNKKKTEIVVLKGTKNSLTVTACVDTANNKAAGLYSKDKLVFSGEGKLDILATGKGCKGISAKDDIIINQLTLDVKTTGDNLGPDTLNHMGFGGFGGPGGFGGFGGDGNMQGPPPMHFNFDELPDSVKQQFEEMRKRFENGEFPHFGGPGGMQGPPQGGFGGGMPGGGMPGGMQGPPQGGFGGFGDGMQGPPEGGGWMGKQKFLGTCKGVKSNGVITINSGNVTVYTTSRGAEGIEGKKGVIINGGEVSVDAMDDAINSNGQIAFNGGKTTAVSRGNDAVDSNLGGMFGPGGGGFPPFGGGWGNVNETETENSLKRKNEKTQERKNETETEPSIVIGGGEVYAYSKVGPPEEGLDCDFAPIGVTNGKAFSIGAGMGEMPSVPTSATAKQPTALLIGLTLVEGKDVVVKNSKGKVIMTITAPFSFRNSSSLITCPDFKKGESFTVETEGYQKTFRFDESFMVVR